MRVLYISRENAPGDHGGAVHTWQVASILARSDRVTLLCHRAPGEPVREQRDGVEVLRHDMSLSGRKVPLRALGTLRSLRDHHFDVVVERFDAFGGLGSLIARQRSVPLVLEVNYPHLKEMRIKWHHRGPLWRLLATAAAPLELWSSWQLDRAAAIVAPRASIVPSRYRPKVHLAHWGADVEHFVPAGHAPTGDAATAAVRQRLDLSPGPVLVLHGSFRPWHGTGVIPAAVAGICRRHADALFLFIGHGEGIDSLRQQLAERELLERCRFAGLVPYHQVPSLLRTADVALAPFSISAYPPLQRFGFFWSPAKIFEYMACGLPIVTTDQDYLLQVVGATGAGVCVAEDSEPALVAACLELLANPERRSIMGSAGRQAAEHRFSWQTHVAALRSVLAQHVAPLTDIHDG